MFNIGITSKNKKKVLFEILFNPGVCRSELAELTQVSKTLVSKIVSELLEKKHIVEQVSTVNDTTIGRKPIPLYINKKNRISVSIKIKSDSLLYMFTSLEGEVIKVKRKFISIYQVNFLDTLKKIIMEDSNYKFKVIGITLILDNQLEDAEYIFYDEVKEIIIEEFGIDVRIEEDNKMSAFEEIINQQNYTNIFHLSLDGTITGSNTSRKSKYHVINNKLNISHTSINANGKLCQCGNRGCIQQYCSSSVLLRDYRKAKSNATLANLIEGYKMSEDSALNIINTFKYYLRILLHNINMTQNPEIVLISSEIVRELPEILDAISRTMGENSKSINKVQVYQSEFGEYSSLIGANYLNIINFFMAQL